MTPSTLPVLTDLPLFPLHSHLYPDGLLPLNIFEVRYLDMIARRHAAGEPFGVVCLSAGSEVRRPAAGPGGDGFAHEAFFPIGTLARITLLERPQPGLLVIRCVGTRRFRVVRSERRKFGLWVADAESIEDDALVPVPDELAFTRTALRDLVHNIEHAQQGGDTGYELPLVKPYRWNDCGWLANRWCELLPLNPATRQQLLGLDNPVLRLELIAETLGPLGFARGG